VHENFKRLLNVYVNMASNGKTQMVLIHNNNIVVSKSQQPSMMSARQFLLKFIHPNIAKFLPRELC